jgi:hypothetical protein
MPCDGPWPKERVEVLVEFELNVPEGTHEPDVKQRETPRPPPPPSWVFRLRPQVDDYTADCGPIVREQAGKPLPS